MILLSILFLGAQVLDPCAFCDPKILDAQTVYHGAHASVLITYQPAVEGHLLIIPNRHVQAFHELNAEEITEIGALVQKVAAVYKGREYLLLQKNGPGAGQTVPHVHVHFVPRPEEMSSFRFACQLLTASWWAPQSEAELKALQEKFALALKPEN